MIKHLLDQNNYMFLDKTLLSQELSMSYEKMCLISHLRLCSSKNIAYGSSIHL
ncbi:5740_t:CDS:2 [Funneliformis mosseae]|uniref:5740_t:CDS:1 n=1 Tax=Funneliformis mosseae TaxID=27381 RepID=A0A9N8ZUN6_FUNMO|nr:5740_t:CDS:2 [Funneliformis mosseae]